ncbi:MAG: discoidin domain-containing protein [Oscillospiraceae bacterium]|nr:discoidin domain-containing protein [Oscillospiraceae bacterium]
MDGLNWPKGQIFPRFGKTVKPLDAVFVGREPNDVKLLVTGLQGLANRIEPQIIVFDKPKSWQDTENWPGEHGIEMAETDNYYALIKKYKSLIKGIIVYDDEIFDTKNIATTLAGFEDALIVSARIADILTLEPFGFKILHDFRGRFKDKFEVYDYALENIWPKCTKRLFVSVDAEQHHLAYIRDLAVAAKLMVMWLDPRIEKEAEYIKKFFKDTTPVETYCIGWGPEEGATIRINSEHGIPTVPADYYENYTVYSGFSQELNVPVIPKKPKLETKFYVAFMVSDGDNIQYCQHAMKKDDVLWPNKNRGKYPISWTCSPALYDAGPQMLNFFYNTATENDLIISGPSGLGYTDPQRWKNEWFEKYCTLTNEYFRKTGYNYIAAWNFIRDDQDYIYEEYCPSLTGVSIQERMDGQVMFKIMKDEMPLLTAKPRYDGDEPRVLRILTEDIEAWDGHEPMFYCPQAVSWEMGVEGINRVYEALRERFGDKVEFVRADHLAMLFREAYGCPFCVSLQAKATASSTDPDENSVSFCPDKVTNGSFTKGQGWKTSKSGDSWVCVDLGEEYEISRYVLMNAECAYSDKSLNTKDFKIQVSLDGKSWIDADTVTGNTDAWLDKKVEPVNGRYARIYITNPGADGVARIQQFEVHGKK